jgi:hypothetical protein
VLHDTQGKYDRHVTPDMTPTVNPVRNFITSHHILIAVHCGILITATFGKRNGLLKVGECKYGLGMSKYVQTIMKEMYVPAIITPTNKRTR